MQLKHLVERLDDRLDIEAYRDRDPSVNGLQVGDGTASIEHVVGAVDAATETIERAAALDADLLIVHHGLLWGESHPLTGHHYERIRLLIEHDIALYGVHLPLDGHQTLGNAAIIGDELDLAESTPFPDDELPIGVVGTTASQPSSAELENRIADIVDIDPDAIKTVGPDPGNIERLAIVTGRGTGFLDAAASTGVDALLTGEGKHETYHEAADRGLRVILAGHYATETTGVKAVLELLQDWELETSFVDIPTGF